jgi:hypothetical protein
VLPPLLLRINAYDAGGRGNDSETLLPPVLLWSCFVRINRTSHGRRFFFFCFPQILFPIRLLCVCVCELPKMTML